MWNKDKKYTFLLLKFVLRYSQYFDSNQKILSLLTFSSQHVLMSKDTLYIVAACS